MPNWIGDFVMALSVIARKAAEPDISLTLLVPEHLVRLSCLISSLPVLAYRRSNRSESLETIKMVKNAGFDKLYLLPHSFSSAWFGFRTGISARRGISSEQRRILLTESVSSRASNRNKHLTREYSTVLETSFIEPDLWSGMGLDASDPEYEGAVVLCPGAAYGPAKKWPEFNVLIRLMHEKEIVILGDKSDMDLALKIAHHMPHRVHNLTGTTSIEEAVSIISGASVVISNDSGLMHIAGFLGVPVVGIYGSTSPNWTRPLGNAVRIASANLDCSPCYKRTCSKKHYSCLLRVSAESVVQLASEISR